MSPNNYFLRLPRLDEDGVNYTLASLETPGPLQGVPYLQDQVLKHESLITSGMHTAGVEDPATRDTRPACQ